jgi:dTDP-4-dehydrorhamnose reductase
MLALAERLAAGSQLTWGTYHFASAGSTSWHGLAEAIVEEQERFSHRRPRVTPITTADYPTPAKRPRSSVLDTSRFEKTFGLTPAPWRDELRAVVAEVFGHVA